jgi:hypothetical protein
METLHLNVQRLRLSLRRTQKFNEAGGFDFEAQNDYSVAMN